MRSYERDHKPVEYLSNRLRTLTRDSELGIYRVGIAGTFSLFAMFIEPVAGALFLGETVRQGYLQARARDRCEAIKDALRDQGVSSHRILHFEEGGA